MFDLGSVSQYENEPNIKYTEFCVKKKRLVTSVNSLERTKITICVDHVSNNKNKRPQGARRSAMTQSIYTPDEYSFYVYVFTPTLCLPVDRNPTDYYQFIY